MSAYPDIHYLRALIRSGDVITPDGHARVADADLNIVYAHRSLVFRSGTWRGHDVRRLALGGQPLRGRTVVLGHSDLMSGRGTQTALRAAGARRLWATNMVERAPFARSLPLGLTSQYEDTPLHRTLGDISHLEQAFENTPLPDGYTGTVFASFNVDNAPRYRRDLLRLTAQQPGFVWIEPEYTDVGRRRFLAQLRTHDFVLCPRGNGQDTHRLWETLYMGGIPVLLRRETFPPLVAGLPVLVVDRWEEILNEEHREASWWRLRAQPASLEKLSQAHWIDRIRASAHG